MQRESQIDPGALLAWYDRHRRRLPWRAEPGQAPHPYGVWLSEIMLQQTTVQAVKPYYEKFLARWPRVEDLASAASEDVMQAWAGLGYYARARNLHACAKAVTLGHNGQFPESETGLRALPGIGAYTAAAIAAIAFDQHAVVVDGNVERVVSRLHRLETPLPRAKLEIRRLTALITPTRRSGDFAQAMMDLGSAVCTPRKPACAICPWIEGCEARRAGDQEDYPVKARKAERPVRRGAAFVAFDPDGAIVVRTRPETGLLGAMLEVPGSEWEIDAPSPLTASAAPLAADWLRLGETATHTFTHFRLELTVFVTEISRSQALPDGMRWLPAEAIAEAGFPTAIRKVTDIALRNYAAKA